MIAELTLKIIRMALGTILIALVVYAIAMGVSNNTVLAENPPGDVFQDFVNEPTAFMLVCDSVRIDTLTGGYIGYMYWVLPAGTPDSVYILRDTIRVDSDFWSTRKKKQRIYQF
jgi:hypothetical protein